MHGTIMKTELTSSKSEKEININTLSQPDNKAATHVLKIDSNSNNTHQAEVLARLLKRQTIYGKSGQITAVELVPRIRLAYNADVNNAKSLRDGDDATLFAGVFSLTEEGKRLLHPLLISIDIQNLTHTDVHYLPAAHVIFALDVHDISHVTTLIPTIKNLLSQGYRLILNWSLNKDIPETLLSLIKQVRVDVGLLNAIDLEQTAKLLHEQGVEKIHVHNIGCQETLIVCQKLKLDSFAGDFCDFPFAFNGKLIEVNPARVRELMAAVIARQDLSVIETMMKFDARLIYQLISHVNTVNNNDNTISSIAEALQQLKLEGLKRWLSLLLNACVAPNANMLPLLKRGLSRALFLEAMSRKSLQVQDPQTMYLAGLLSVMDKLLGQPIPTIINALKLNDELKQAVIEYKGDTGLMLKLALAAESNQPNAIDNYAARCLISSMDVNLAMINALVAAETSAL